MVDVNEIVSLIKEIQNDLAFLATFEESMDTKHIDAKVLNLEELFLQRYGFVPKVSKPNVLLRYVKLKERVSILERVIK